MPLRLQDIGLATSYATVAVGAVAKEQQNARDAAAEVRKDPRIAASIGEPEIIFLLGQADVAMMIEARDFRHVFALRYPRAKSDAAAVNWVFSVPYLVPELDAAARPRGGDLLRFILHLRLRRHVYVYPHAEEEIVRRIATLLGEHQKGARIHAGLGWSDLICDGRFTRETFDELVEFIITLHGLRLQLGDGTTLPVLQRLLTVIGYCGDPPRFGNSTHATLLRAVPGAYAPAEAVRRDGDEVYILDGKADFLLISRDAPEEWLRDQQKLGTEQYENVLQKVETHLMFRPAEAYRELGGDRNGIIRLPGPRMSPAQCGCDRHTNSWIHLIETAITRLSTRRLLPTEERYAIDNVLFILGATLRDSSICCDASQAISGCYYGLLVILDAIEEKADGMPDGLGGGTMEDLLRRRHDWWQEIVYLWRRLDDWHRFTDLLLRQRTVGSYEEILGQTDRSVVYSGGVQKFLYLADSLVNDFARRVHHAHGKEEGPPLFTTIYDSVKTPLRIGSGLVRIPTRNIFSLPLAVADLWHEVGAELFLLRYAAGVAERVPPEERTAMIANLADHYGDLIAYFYGFRTNFEKFLASMAHAWNATYGDIVATREYNLLQLLPRLYLVYELHELRSAREQRDAERLRTLSTPAGATDLIDELRARFRAIANRYTSLDIEGVLWTDLWAIVTHDSFSDFRRWLYMPLVREDIDPTEPTLQPFEDGEVQTFTSADDLNAYFARVAHYIQAPDRDEGIPLFRMMAALGKSAAIEYHRRQITIRE